MVNRKRNITLKVLISFIIPLLNIKSLKAQWDTAFQLIPANHNIYVFKSRIKFTISEGVRKLSQIVSGNKK